MKLTALPPSPQAKHLYCIVVNHQLLVSMLGCGLFLRAHCIGYECLVNCRHAVKSQLQGIALERIAEFLSNAAHQVQGFAIGIDGFLGLALAQQHVATVKQILGRRFVVACDSVIIIDGTLIVVQQERTPGNRSPRAVFRVTRCLVSMPRRDGNSPAPYQTLLVRGSRQRCDACSRRLLRAAVHTACNS